MATIIYSTLTMSSVMSSFSDMILFNPYCKFEKLITIQIIDEKPEA